MTDYKALKDAAEKATPGPWTVGEDTTSDGALYPCGINGPSFAVIQEMDDCSEDDANFIALANPQTVLTLIRHNETMKAALEEIGNEQSYVESQSTGMKQYFATDGARLARKALKECE